MYSVEWKREGERYETNDDEGYIYELDWIEVNIFFVWSYDALCLDWLGNTSSDRRFCYDRPSEMILYIIYIYIYLGIANCEHICVFLYR